jgi:hypothetical protein
MSGTPGSVHANAYPEPGDPGLLGNMSSRPRTDIQRVVPPVLRTWVLFTRAELRRGRDPGVLSATVLARLDRRWRELGLTGASVVSRRGIAVPGVTPLVCRERDLILNVLLRVRGDLLVHRMPLLDRIDPDVSGSVLCADPRLHAAVLATTGGSDA